MSGMDLKYFEKISEIKLPISYINDFLSQPLLINALATATTVAKVN